MYVYGTFRPYSGRSKRCGGKKGCRTHATWTRTVDDTENAWGEEDEWDEFYCDKHKAEIEQREGEQEENVG